MHANRALQKGHVILETSRLTDASLSRSNMASVLEMLGKQEEAQEKFKLV